MAVTSASVVMRASFAWRPDAECRSAPRRWSVSWREGRHGIRIEAVSPGQKNRRSGNVPLFPAGGGQTRRLCRLRRRARGARRALGLAYPGTDRSRFVQELLAEPDKHLVHSRHRAGTTTPQWQHGHVARERAKRRWHRIGTRSARARHQRASGPRSSTTIQKTGIRSKRSLSTSGTNAGSRLTVLVG